jgi:hypothetical protein
MKKITLTTEQRNELLKIAGIALSLILAALAHIGITPLARIGDENVKML